MIKNICILMSPSESSFQYTEKIYALSINLGLGVLGGYLQDKGYNVKMRDLNITLVNKYKDENSKKLFEIVFDINKFKNYIFTGNDIEIDSLIESFLSEYDIANEDIYGVSIGSDFSFLQIQFGFLLAKYIKIKFNKHVFIGGNNISFLYIFKDVFKEMWEIVLSEFKFIINGPGERCIDEIIQDLNNNTNSDKLSSINGIINYIDGEIISNPTMKPLIIKPDWGDMDLSYYTKCMISENDSEKAIKENLIYFYKWPDTFAGSVGQIINKYNKLRRSDVSNKLIIPYIFNYNCPYNCAFCTQSDIDRSSIIGGDPDEVIKDVIALKEKYNTNYFYFLNNAFNFSPKFVDSFCKKIIDINLEIHWSDCGRFNNLTYERLELMKKAGCVKLTFGFESGSLKIIELIDKRINLDHAERVLKWCYELGIWVDIEVIVGLPQEYDEDFNATCEFINKNKKYINYFWINEFFVVPNSLIGRYPEKYGIELIKDINNYRKLLDNNLKMFKRESDNVMTSNSKLFGFNEINRRNFDAIVSDNRKKISKLSNMQNSEFNEAAKFYTMLCEIK
ncbi:hypothetical protein UT300018_12470 [Clostridium faecium]